MVVMYKDKKCSQDERGRDKEVRKDAQIKEKRTQKKGRI
jgi:hypothetical protein